MRNTISVTLEIKDLHASIDGKEILKGVDLTIKQGEIHGLMLGPNISVFKTPLMARIESLTTSASNLMGRLRHNSRGE